MKNTNKPDSRIITTYGFGDLGCGFYVYGYPSLRILFFTKETE